MTFSAEKKTEAGSTRQRILSTALIIMKTKGYQGTTIRDICQKVGIAPSSFYSHFHSKSDLLRDIYAESDRYFSTELPSLLEGRNFKEQLEIFVKAYARLNIETGLDTMRVLFNPENVWFSQNRPMQKTLLKIFLSAIEQRQLPEDTDPLSLVKGLFIVLRGTCYDWCVYNGKYDLEEAMLKQMRYFFWGVLNENEKEETLNPSIKKHTPKKAAALNICQEYLYILCEFVGHSFEIIGSKGCRLSNNMYKYS